MCVQLRVQLRVQLHALQATAQLVKGILGGSALRWYVAELRPSRCSPAGAGSGFLQCWADLAAVD
jgi:hypothetical protein